MTEAMATTGEDVFVVGAGNSAGQAALYLGHHARTVTILVRGKSLADSMSSYLVERIDSADNIAVRYGVSITELHGATSLEGLSIAAGGAAPERLKGRAAFVFIGAAPRTEWLAGHVQLDSHGFVLSGPDLERNRRKRVPGWPLEREPYWLETSVPGIFVAGDVRHDA